MDERDKSHAARLKLKGVWRALRRLRGAWALPRARLALFVEEAAAAFFPLLVFACGVAAFVLSGAAMFVAELSPAAHDALRALSALGVAGLMMLGLARLWRRRDVMSRWRARRRVETLSALAHAPLTALYDKPVDKRHPWSAALWRRHRRAMARRYALARARGEVGGGRLIPPLADIDPWGLRMAAAAALLLSWLAAGESASARLYGFSSPASRALAHGVLDAWLEPPAYTGLATTRLAGGEGGVARIAAKARPDTTPFDVPAGSVFHAVWHDRAGGGYGDGEAPRLVLQGHAGVRRVEFSPLASSSWKVEAPLDGDTEGASASLSVVRGGHPHTSWPLRFIPDRPPQAHLVALERRPFETVQDFAYAALDDYGVSGLSFHMEALQEAPHVSGAGVVGCRTAERHRSLAFDLAVGVTRPSLEGRIARDMTAHPLAGEGVAVWLQTSDALEQNHKSATLSLRLPERGVRRPEAQKLMALRKTLFCAKPPLSRVAQGVASVAAALRRPSPATVAADGVAAADLSALSSDADAWEGRAAAGDAFNDAMDDMAMRLWRIALALDGWQGARLARSLEETLQQLDEAIAREDAASMEDHAALLREMLGDEGEGLEEWLQGLELALEEARAGAGEAARERLKGLQESLALWEAESFAARAREELAREVEALREMQDELHQRTGEAARATRPEGRIRGNSLRKKRNAPPPPLRRWRRGRALWPRRCGGCLRAWARGLSGVFPPLPLSGFPAGARRRGRAAQAILPAASAFLYAAPMRGSCGRRKPLKRATPPPPWTARLRLCALLTKPPPEPPLRARAAGSAAMAVMGLILWGGLCVIPPRGGRLRGGRVDLPQGASLRESHRVLRALRDRLNKSAPQSEERRYLKKLLPRYEP